MAQLQAQQQPGVERRRQRRSEPAPTETPATPDAARGGQRMNLARSLGSVGGLTLVSRVLALVRDTLQAQLSSARASRRTPSSSPSACPTCSAPCSPKAPSPPRSSRCSTARSAKRTMSNAGLALRRADAGGAAAGAAAVHRPHARSPPGRSPGAFRAASRIRRRAVRLRGHAVADHHPLSDADQPRLAARRHPQFARTNSGSTPRRRSCSTSR